MQPLLERYSTQQIEVIESYWDTIRWTRSTGKVSNGIKTKELEYWSKYPTDLVIQALETHVAKYPNIKEHYTRGIIRNLSKGGSVSPTQSRKREIPIIQPSLENTVSDEQMAEYIRFAEIRKAKKQSQLSK
ncbi:hypothetical protein [Paenibacillus sanguinis]|uniref:hypothetical protein n=1 Tax=Paenibacillus sanguinis TaxID=225906 RepID=UPI00036FCD50|nr:hypothetical protein [Paenibacillus sanguinis]